MVLEVTISHLEGRDTFTGNEVQQIVDLDGTDAVQVTYTDNRTDTYPFATITNVDVQ